MFKITHINGVPNQYALKEFILGDLDDVEKLPKAYGVRGSMNDPNDSTIDEPCAIGSTAIYADGSVVEVFILTPNNEWVKM